MATKNGSDAEAADLVLKYLVGMQNVKTDIDITPLKDDEQGANAFGVADSKSALAKAQSTQAAKFLMGMGNEV
jgi:hypothetical protein